MIIAPALFRLLTNSTSNWTLIKIVKIFCNLLPYEERLVKKLLPPLTTLIQTTAAMSLLSECLYTVFSCGLLQHLSEEISSMCFDRLAELLNSPDSNLQHAGLSSVKQLAMISPKELLPLKEPIFNCFQSADSTIRMKTLEIICLMVGLCFLYSKKR